MNHFFIRPFNPENDFETVLSWWEFHKEIPPTIDMLPVDSTFMLDNNYDSWLCVTVYLTNSREIAWVDNLVSNPKISSDQDRAAAVELLQSYLESWCRGRGYTKLFCMSETPKLGKRYQELGYIPTASGITTFIKKIGEGICHQ